MNSIFGKFINKKNEYLIKEPKTPRPWKNYLWNNNFITYADQLFNGESLTKINDKKILISNNRILYIRDNNSKDYWNVAFYNDNKKIKSYACYQGLKYSKFIFTHKQIKTELLIFVPPSDPLEIWTLKISNNSKVKRSLSLFTGVSFLLKTINQQYYGGIENFLFSFFDKQYNAIIVENKADEKEYKNCAFFITDKICKGFECRYSNVFDIYNNTTTPLPVLKNKCKNEISSAEKPTALFHFQFQLKPKESSNFNFIIGTTKNLKNLSEIRKKYIQKNEISKEFIKLITNNKSLINSLTINTPDKNINRMINLFNKNQLDMASKWARIWMIGFRDILQDNMAFLSIDYKQTEKALIEAMKHQYKNGHCLRGWAPLDTHNYSDGPVWLCWTLIEYLKETKNFEFLNKKIEYYDKSKGTVYEHIIKGINYLYKDRGKHKLCKIHFGDWNDSLNIGKNGKGESVWLTMMLKKCMDDLSQLAKILNKRIEYHLFKKRAKKLKNIINKTGWDGKWYLVGYDDYGNKIGSHLNEEAKIYLITQVFSIICNIASSRFKNNLPTLYKKFATKYGFTLMDSPYTKYYPNIGRISSMVPGHQENASIYHHMEAFKALADIMRNDIDEAYKTLNYILPKNTFAYISHSKSEPYAFTNMFFGPSHPRFGESLVSWITGTAGWFFQIVTEWLIGIRRDYNGLIVDPKIPKKWEYVYIKRYFRKNIYNIHIYNNNRNKMEIIFNNKQIKGNILPILNDGSSNEVKIFL